MTSPFQQDRREVADMPAGCLPGVVSFLIVNYNGGPMLAECIESVRRQTYRDYGVIVVDNGSTDHSGTFHWPK